MPREAYEFDAVIEAASQPGGAFVRFPWDVRAEFGAGRARVLATFDGAPYAGSLVNMGLKNEDGSVCYLIGVTRDIRRRTGKDTGDRVRVVIRPAVGPDRPGEAR